MKKNLAIILTLALVLSVAAVGFAFTASANTTDWATEYANEVWAAVQQEGTSAYTPKVRLRGGTDILDINAGDTKTFTEDEPYGNIIGGTLTVGLDGIVELNDIVQTEEAKQMELICWGAAKIVLKDDTCWSGCIESWPSDPGGTNNSNGAFTPILVTSENGGTWTCNGYNNPMRNNDTYIIYGNIELDLSSALITKDAVNTAPSVDAYLRNTLVIAPQLASTIKVTFSGEANYTGGQPLAYVHKAGDVMKVVFGGNVTLDMNDCAMGAPVAIDVVDGTLTVQNGDLGSAPLTISGDAVVNAPSVTSASVTIKDTAKLNVATAIDSAIPVTTEGNGTYYVDGTLTSGVPAPDDTVLESSDADLSVNFSNVTSAGKLYAFDVLWQEDDVTFNYAAGLQGAWNPDNLDYGPIEDAGWSDDTLNVTVKNHSNAAVDVTMSITDTNAEDGLSVTTAYGEVEYSADDKTVELPTAENTAVENAPQVAFTLKIEGTPTEAVTGVATATITFAAAE